ncbi:CdaR family protein [Heliophilum fasciatum]|uniref:YbbR domain-containing protein n=1 Tax=Heliophilum fasciatum TaxID=35700 RepID=A0A4R2RPM1_9FIRM|nr:CdaR family protein [Heliophilum fasciatum]MCW2277650.1 YbbR domain-containing protein [Heliophilum fasciatum]TCP64998.1 YbbR domain-containing protein [Heliophilum fasciatum]
MNWASIARRNWVYKVAALVLSVLLWVYVQAEQQGSQVLTIPLDVEGLEAGYVLDPEPPKVVELKVKGPKASLTTLSSRDFRARISLTGARPGSVVIAIQVDSPPAVQVISKTPAELELNVDTLHNRSIPVAYEFKGTLPAGYKAGQPVIRPGEVMVSGAKNRVDAINRVYVQIPVNSKENLATSLPVRLQIPGGTGEDNNVRISPKAVDVYMPVTEEEQARTVQVRPVQSGSPADGYKVAGLRVEPAQVAISGTSSALQTITAISTASLDVNGARADVVRDLPLLVPNGVKVSGPQSVRVTAVVVPANSGTVPTPAPAPVPEAPKEPVKEEPTPGGTAGTPVGPSTGTTGGE